MSIVSRLLSAAMVGVCTAASASAQAPPAALTIQQAVGEALDHNLRLLADRFDVQIADAAALTASLRPNPVVTVSTFHPDTALANAGVSPDEQVFRTDWVIEGGAKRQRRIDEAALGKSVAALNLLDATRTLVLDVQSAFVDVQLAELNLALARQNLDVFDNLVSINVERVRTGDLSGVELSRSQLAMLQFENDVAQQQTKLQVARTRLSLLVGRGPSGDGLEVAGDLRRDAQPLSLDDLRRLALERRPDVRAARTDQARSVADLRLQLANGRIDYTVSGEYHRAESPTVSGNGVAASISVPLPIFTRNQGEVARARVQQEQLETRLHAVEAEVSAEVGSAYTEYLSTKATVDRVEGEMLTRARDVRSTTEYSYRRGEASFIEFLDAVRAFNDTMQSYNEARAEYARSLYTLDSISGQVNP